MNLIETAKIQENDTVSLPHLFDVGRSESKLPLHLTLIQANLRKNPLNHVKLVEDDNDYTLEWWDSDNALTEITFWEDGIITFLKGKAGRMIAREEYRSTESFVQAHLYLLR